MFDRMTVDIDLWCNKDGAELQGWKHRLQRFPTGGHVVTLTCQQLQLDLFYASPAQLRQLADVAAAAAAEVEAD